MAAKSDAARTIEWLGSTAVGPRFLGEDEPHV